MNINLKNSSKVRWGYVHPWLFYPKIKFIKVYPTFGIIRPSDNETHCLKTGEIVHVLDMQIPRESFNLTVQRLNGTKVLQFLTFEEAILC